MIIAVSAIAFIVHGGIRHLESRVVGNGDHRCVHGGIRHLENLQN